MVISQPVAWIVSAILIEAAVIDGAQLRVPNWLTYHFILLGLVVSALLGGTTGLLWALAGTGLGLALLMPLYAIGGMGAGDVKLLAGIGAWFGPTMTWHAFLASAVVGGLMALVMMYRSGDFIGHIARMKVIADEVLKVRDPVRLSEIAAERKPRMLLLPYGIPIAIGTIGYLAFTGMLL